MRILLTGATGYLGSVLAESLAKDGHEIAAICRPGSARNRCGATVSHWFEANSNYLGLREFVADFHPEQIYHLATYYRAEHQAEDLAPLIESNLALGLHLLDAAAAASCLRLINFTTTWEHYQDETYNPVCLYAATKAAFRALAKFYVEARGMKVTTLELSDTYGPGDFRQKLISVLRRAAQTGLTLEMSEGNQNLDLVYVDDVMAAIRNAGQLQFEVTSMGEQIYQISAGKWITLKDFVERFERVSQKKVNVRWGVKPYRAREVMRPWTQGAPVPGWSPRVSLDQGIKLTLDMDLA